MRASVIVPAFNVQDTLARCLGALNAQTFPSQDYEVIVVDDGSTDATAQQVASFHRARCISIPHGGAAAARNRGANAARGDVLLFTDADCEPQPDWIEKMLAAFEDPNVVGAKGTYRTRQRQRVAQFVQLEYEEKYSRMRRARTIDFVDTYSAAYRRAVFLANDGFDESFPIAEDQEFSFRLARRGVKMVFVSDAVVYHQHAATLGAYLWRKFWIGYWKVLVHTRHPSKLWRDSHTPPMQKLQTVLFLPMMASLVAAPFVPFAWLGFMALLLVFAVSAMPLLFFISRRDATIVWTAAAMIFFRAGALSVGLAVGVIGEYGLRRLWKKPSMKTKM